MASPQEELFMSLLCGQVTHIVDPSDFWLRMGSEMDLVGFEEFEQRLDPALRQLPVGRTDQVVENCTVLVCCFNQDNRNLTHWRRATVIRTDRRRNTFDVFYIDYGSTEIVPATSICQTVPKDIEEYPSYCYRCALAGIQPIARSWTSRGVKTFEKLASRTTLKVAIVSYDHFSMSHRVALYHSGDGERSLTHLMLDAETGLKTDENVEEYAEDVVPVPYEVLYGCNIDYDQLYEPLSELPSEDSSISRGQISEETNQADQAFCSNSSLLTTSVEGSECDDAASDYSAKHVSNPSQNSAVDDNDDVDSEDCSSEDTLSPTDAVVVPTFNLSVLHQRPMLSAEELQREREEAAKAERKAELQRDMINCHRDLDNINMTMGQGQRWGKSDLLIGQHLSEEHDVDDAVDHGVEEVFKDADTGNDDSDKKVEENAKVSTEGKSPIPSDKDDQSETASDSGNAVHFTTPPEENKPDRHAVYEEESVPPLLSRSAGSSARERISFPPPPQRQLTGEEREYYRQKQFKEILHEVVQGEDPDMVCAKFFSLVPADVDHSEQDMKLLMQLLLEEAVKDDNVTDTALEIVSKYASVLTTVELRGFLKYCQDKFVKLPVAKMSRYHCSFGTVVIKLLHLGLEWSSPLRNVILEFTLQCLERWVIFNKKGNQKGLIQRQLETMYLECTELLLPPSLPLLQGPDPERLHFIFSEMREKVLETDVELEIRSRLLTLLVKFGGPHLDPDDEENMSEGSPVKSTDGQIVVKSLPSPYTSPATTSSQSSLSTLEEGNQKRPVPTRESSSQTEDGWRRSEDKAGLLEDEAVQTEIVLEVAQLRKASFGSLDSWLGSMESGERIDLASTPGRARRRRAVVEHLQKKDSTRSSMCSSPDTTQPSFTTSTTTDVHAQQFCPDICPNVNNKSDQITAQAKRDMGQGHNSSLDETSKVLKSDGDVEGVSKSAQKTVFSAAVGGKGLSTSSDVDASGNTSGVEKGEGSAGQDQFPQDTSARSFFTAMSSVSRSAFESLFGSKADKPCFDSSSVESESVQSGNTSVKSIETTHHHNFGAGGTASLPEKDNSQINPGFYSADAETDLDACFASQNVMEKSKATEKFTGGNTGNGSDIVLSSSCSADTANYPGNEPVESCLETELDYFSSESEDEEEYEAGPSYHYKCFVDGYKAPKDHSYSLACSDDKKETFTEADFPPLEREVAGGDPHFSIPPVGGQLTLQSIASNILAYPPGEPATEKLDKSLEANGALISKAKLKSEKKKKSEAAAEELCSDDKDDSNSVPSDWEDRVSPAAATFASIKDGGDECKTEAGGSGIFGEDHNYSLHGAGNRLKDDSHSWKHPRFLDASGDSTASEFSTSITENTAETGSNSGGLTCSSHTDEDDLPMPIAGDTSSPYKRGDLGRMARPKSRGRKKITYRPFDEVPTAAASKPEPRPMWIPTIMCTNCGVEGHIRNECPKPIKHLLFN